jgi:predicted Zn-dependent protease
MGIKTWFMRKLASRILKDVTPYFNSGGVELKVLIDSKITEDFTPEINEGLKAFASIITKVSIGQVDFGKCWNPQRGQYDLTSLISEKRNALTLYILKDDIYVKSLNWAYGVTSPIAGCSAVSIARFSDSEMAKKLKMVFTELETRKTLVLEVKHEVGHLLGLTDHPEGKHVGSCAMNQTMHMETPDSTRTQESAGSNIFCDECAAWITSFSSGIAQGKLEGYSERIAQMLLGG